MARETVSLENVRIASNVIRLKMRHHLTAEGRCTPKMEKYVREHSKLRAAY